MIWIAGRGPGTGSTGSRSQADTAEHERRPELLAAPRDRERADHVTAADPEDQRRAAHRQPGYG